MKKLTIITINKNNRIGLGKTLDSISEQSWSDYELIVVDGGSEDGSIDIISKYRDKIAISVTESDGGIYDAQNKGVRLASGEYCIFMNAGDVFYNNSVLEKVFSIPRVADVLYGDFVHGSRQINYPPKMTFLFFYKTGFCSQAVFVKTVHHKKNPFDTRYRIMADREFFYKMFMCDASFEYVNAVVCIYDASGISNSEEFKEVAISEDRFIKDKYVPGCIQVDYYILTRIKDFNRLYSDLFMYPRLRSMTSIALQPIFFIYKVYHRMVHWGDQ